MLGVEDCCAIQLAPAPNPDSGVKVDAPAQREAITPAPQAATKAPTTEQKQSVGFFAGLAKTMTDAIAQRAATAESEKRTAGLDRHLLLLKEGVLVTRHMPAEASKPVKLYLYSVP
jgi:hypothetical protein